MYPVLTSYDLTAGPQVLLCYVNDIGSGIFMHMALLAIWVVLTAGMFMVMKRNSGYGDFPASMAVGSFTTLIFAIILRLIDCGANHLVSNIALGVCIAMALLSFLFLLFSRD